MGRERVLSPSGSKGHMPENPDLGSGVFGGPSLFYKMVWDLRLVGPKLKVIRFGAHGHVQKSGNPENADFSGFPKLHRTDINPNKQNNYTEILGHHSIKVCNRMAFQTSQMPNPYFSLDCKYFTGSLTSA